MSGHTGMPLNHLPERVKSFRSRGHIDMLQESEYVQLVVESESGGNNDAMRSVERALDSIERTQKEKSNVSVGTEDTNRSGNKITDATTNENSPDNRIESEVAAAGITNKKPLRVGESNKQHQKQQFKPVNMPEDIAKKLSRKQMEDLFVEMCFFARLGFLQPPTCLRCAYRASGASKKSSANIRNNDSYVPSKGCNRLVMWRKDANLPIHPDRMQSNTIIVTCQTARAWMDRDTVSNLRWDAKARILASGQE
mmetsp:Transcript_814/g.1728  ORF Transcript_814/g.1728 Transcript_814/m.1728 type:complete len:253 (-) Transcript_814:105-863(-)